MLCFWVLNLCHRDGHKVNSVYTNLGCLMLYWGHKLNNHDDIQVCEIKQEYISCDRLTDAQETLIEVEVFDKQREEWVRFYFMDAKDVVSWQTFQEGAGVYSFEYSTMMLRTMHICRD